MEVQEREIDRVIDYIRSCQEAKEKQQVMILYIAGIADKP